MFKQILFIICLSSLFGTACSDDDANVTLSLIGAPAITSPSSGNSYLFDASMTDEPMDIFTWTAADFGFQSATMYKLEMAKMGTGFANPINLGSTSELEIIDLTIGKVNTVMIAALGITDTTNATALEFRICASVSSEVETLCSNPVTLDVVPFPVLVKYDSLSVPGSYQGWDPSSRENVIFSRKNDEIYSGYIYIGEDGAQYKFTKGWSWDVNWGDDALDGTLDPGGADIPITNAGMYFLTCNLNDFTHTGISTNWGVLGDATPTGWDADTDLIWDIDRGVLTATLDLSAGVIKFRANDAWDFNFGDTFNNGLLEEGGDDIPIPEAGNYTIDLILTVGDYTYVLTKN